MNEMDDDRPGEVQGRNRETRIFLPWSRVRTRVLAFLLVIAGILLLLRHFIHAAR